jgi:N-acetylneuraminate synthase
MSRSVRIGSHDVGAGQPCYVIAEIGINHNGDMNIAKRLIDVAHLAGCDAVKFQKRTPEICVPREQRKVERETPWGTMTYMAYRERVEFGAEEYAEIDVYCREKPIAWFASCWDAPSVDVIDAFDPPCYKIASAGLTDTALLEHTRATGRPLILSTGMSTMDEIRSAIELLGNDDLVVLHTTSAYPCPHADINLQMINTLGELFDMPVGYSGHEVGLQISLAAVALGACAIERHVTMDRTMWGSDQAASVEPSGLMRLVRDIRVIETAMGDGIKRVTPSEEESRKRLRK